MNKIAKFLFEQRVYIEDVDAMSCVYHANYLKYCERARTELLNSCGFSHAQMIKEKRNFFVMRRTEMDHFSPAFLGDALKIETRVSKIGGASVTFEQNIYRDDTPIAKLVASLVYVSEFTAIKIPEPLRQIFLQLMPNES